MPHTKAKILDTATRLFADHGYDATSIREIAEEVGVAPALIHHHYESKAELLHALFEKMRVWATEHRRHALERHAGEPLRERCRALIRNTFEMACQRPDYFRVLASTAYSQEVWEAAGMNQLMWEGMTENLGPTFQEWLETYPERGLAPLIQVTVATFGACVARSIVGGGTPPAPAEVSERDWARQWCESMTEAQMRALFPGAP